MLLISCVWYEYNDIFIPDQAGGWLFWVGVCLFFLTKQPCVLDGNMQQYVYRQEPARKCQRRARVTIRYPAFVPRLVIRRRIQRSVQMPTIIRTVRINPHASGKAGTELLLHRCFHLCSFWHNLVWKVLMAVGWHSPVRAAAVPQLLTGGSFCLQEFCARKSKWQRTGEGSPRLSTQLSLCPTRTSPMATITMPSLTVSKAKAYHYGFQKT